MLLLLYRILWIESAVEAPMDQTEVTGKVTFYEDGVYRWIYDMDMQEEETLRIVTSMRGDILNGQISIESPIGKALMGHKVGDVITVKVDDGYSYQVEIRKIIKENDESADHIRSF